VAEETVPANNQGGADCIHEINLALFEETCRVDKLKQLIERNTWFKKCVSYYRKMWKRNASTQREDEHRSASFLRQEYIPLIVNFAWEEVVQKILLRRIRNKLEIIESFDAYIRSSIDGILHEEFWSQSAELIDPDAGVPSKGLIQTRKRLEKAKRELEVDEKEGRELSPGNLERLHAAERNLSQVGLLLSSFGTASKDIEDENALLDTFDVKDDEPFEKESREHLSPLDEEAVTEQQKRIVKSMMNKKLTQRQAEIIRLHYYEGLTGREIATMKGLTDSGISQIKTAAENKLKKSRQLLDLFKDLFK
jgi:RNA polymerase sigma factor (sigma-70 family)